MKVTKLAELFSSYNPQLNQSIKKYGREPEKQSDSVVNSREAVKVTATLALANEDLEHSKRVEEISQRVRSNSYKVDSRDLAKALLRDLF